MTWRSSCTHRISSRSTPGMGAFAGRLNREARVMGGQIDVAEEGVGRLDVGQAGELELLDQTILKRLERPLRASSGLRGESADVLDAQLRERLADLGRTAAGDRAGLGGAEIVRARSV